MSKEILTPDVCVIGAGSGGLSVAAGAAQLGLDVVLLDEAAWKAMMSRGAVQDAKTWAAWGLFQNAECRMQNEEGCRL